MNFKQLISNLHREESGQDLLEYALVLLAVLLAVTAITTSLATTIKDGLTNISGKIQTAIG
jgi:Flp pilus assembly pilin Flp